MNYSKGKTGNKIVYEKKKLLSGREDIRNMCFYWVKRYAKKIRHKNTEN